MTRQRILVFRIGNLGDSLIALPALWFLREHFADAHLSLLCNQSPQSRELAASDLLRDTGLFDGFLHYRGALSTVPLAGKLLDYGRLLATLRYHAFDQLVYLPPTRRTPAEVERDLRFFRLAGIRTILGADWEPPQPAAPQAASARPLQPQPLEAQNLLDRLAASGLPVPVLDASRADVGTTAATRRDVASWIDRQPDCGRRTWIGLGIGSKMPAKQWPVDRYQQVVAQLIRDVDLWPVVFGGPEDRLQAESLVARWGRGYVAAGQLTLGQSAAALERCALYLGNDTGTMHLAAAADVPCVALFSARDWPGKWFPLGSHHIVLRKPLECEGCLLVACADRDNECLRRISVAEVYQACRQLLARSGQHPPATTVVRRPVRQTTAAIQ